MMQRSIKKDVKKEILRGIPNNELEKIFLPDGEAQSKLDIVWYHDMEFKLNGKMYDIVRSEKCKGGTIYYCKNDTNEEKLFSDLSTQIDNHVASNIPLQKKTNNIIKQAFIKDYSHNTNEHVFYLNSFSLYNFDKPSLYSGPKLETISPPPKFV